MDDNIIDTHVWQAENNDDTITGMLTRYDKAHNIVTINSDKHTTQLTLTKGIAFLLWDSLKQESYENIYIDSLK